MGIVFFASIIQGQDLQNEFLMFLQTEDNAVVWIL